MALNDYWRIILFFSGVSADQPQTTHVDFQQATSTDPTIGSIGLMCVNWWTVDQGSGTRQRLYHDASCALQEVTLRRWDPISPFIQSYTTGMPSPGVAVVGEMSGEVAPLVSLRTDFSGGRYRGRRYLPRPDRVVLGAPNTMTPATAQEMANQWKAGFTDYLASIGMREVVYSKTRGSGDYVTSVLVDEVLRVQRPRNVQGATYVTAV